MEEKIVLDRKSFEALAADSRVKILKCLKDRRKTLSELSKELKMSVSGTKEHLQNLEDAELIVKIDDGHKWKYYELTKKGREIVGPKELKVWILLSVSTVALVMSAFALFSLPASHPMEAAMEEEGYAYTVAAEIAEGEIADETQEEKNQEREIEYAASELPVIPLVVGGISAVCIIGSLAILAHNRMK